MVLIGDLGIFHPDWHGWKVKAGELISPEGWIITQGDVLSLPLLRQFISTLRRDNRNLKEELEEALACGFEEQPEPHEIPAEVLAQIK